jgi:putative oxidoreductase
MKRLTGTITPYIYGVMRIVVGLLFACHGAQKLFGFFGGIGEEPGATAPLISLVGLAGVIELVGGLLIAIGLLTSLAALIASGEMAAAYFMAHAPRGFWPIENGGELAVLYCFVFLYIATRGTGRLGLSSSRDTSPLTPMEHAK